MCLNYLIPSTFQWYTICFLKLLKDAQRCSKLWISYVVQSCSKLFKEAQRWFKLKPEIPRQGLLVINYMRKSLNKWKESKPRNHWFRQPGWQCYSFCVILFCYFLFHYSVYFYICSFMHWNIIFLFNLEHHLKYHCKGFV